MVSIIITTYKEKSTLAKAIQSIVDQNLTDYEVLVVGPDQETEKIAKEFGQKHPTVKYLKDQGVGKPAALNLAFRQIRGNILVLTDGDVWIEKKALKFLLEPFSAKGLARAGTAEGGSVSGGKNSKIGAVSGRPISLNSRENIFGYWSHFLTEAAHHMRLNADQRGKDADKRRFPCSGYLYAIRAGLVKEIPENVLSEDAVITEMIRNQGYQVVYAPEAKVYVKYPDNLKDWIKQKVRATGGYKQKSQILNPKPQINSKLKIQDSKIGKMRGFWQEIRDGIRLFFTYPKNLCEFWWTILLYLARLYIWFLIFWRIKIRRQKIGEIWQRIESTK